jgi:hypothetical protein
MGSTRYARQRTGLNTWPSHERRLSRLTRANTVHNGSGGQGVAGLNPVSPTERKARAAGLLHVWTSMQRRRDTYFARTRVRFTPGFRLTFVAGSYSIVLEPFSVSASHGARKLSAMSELVDSWLHVAAKKFSPTRQTASALKPPTGHRAHRPGTVRLDWHSPAPQQRLVVAIVGVSEAADHHLRQARLRVVRATSTADRRPPAAACRGRGRRSLDQPRVFYACAVAGRQVGLEQPGRLPGHGPA